MTFKNEKEALKNDESFRIWCDRVATIIITWVMLSPLTLLLTNPVPAFALYTALSLLAMVLLV